MSLEVWAYKKRLDYLFGKVGTLTGDEYLTAHFSRYLCVLVSGYVEIAITAICKQYAKNISPPLASFVAKQLEGFTNPRMGKILDLVGDFNMEWRSQLQTQTEGQLKASIDSIVANRHNIAHGRDVEITYHRIRDYYADAIKVVALIEDIFK